MTKQIEQQAIYIFRACGSAVEPIVPKNSTISFNFRSTSYCVLHELDANSRWAVVYEEFTSQQIASADTHVTRFACVYKHQHRAVAEFGFVCLILNMSIVW